MWNSHVHRTFPINFESRDISRDTQGDWAHGRFSKVHLLSCLPDPVALTKHIVITIIITIIIIIIIIMYVFTYIYIYI